MHEGIFFFLFFLFASYLHAQSITPFTVNIACLNCGVLQNYPPILTSIKDVSSVIGNDKIIKF